MYAMDAEQFEEAKDLLGKCGHEKYQKHVEKELLSIAEKWVAMFRNEVLIRGHNTHNFAEATIRILKNIILERTKAFNVTAMVDFIANVWESYFQGKLLHCANGREAGPYSKYKQLWKRMSPGNAFSIKIIKCYLY